jgi:hypothetical protein
MRNRLTGWTCLGLLMSCCLISGCKFSPVQIGPDVKETITVLHPGRPIKILRNYTVDARPLADEQAKPAEVDVGGWVAMPPDHWDAVQDRILKLQGDVKSNGDQMNKNADTIKELQAELTREKVPVNVAP